MNLETKEAVECELLMRAIKETNPAPACLEAVWRLLSHLLGCIVRRDKQIAALTEELHGIEQALDDPRIHNTHTILEVLRERLGD